MLKNFAGEPGLKYLENYKTHFKLTVELKKFN